MLKQVGMALSLVLLPVMAVGQTCPDVDAVGDYEFARDADATFVIALGTVIPDGPVEPILGGRSFPMRIEGRTLDESGFNVPVNGQFDWEFTCPEGMPCPVQIQPGRAMVFLRRVADGSFALISGICGELFHSNPDVETVAAVERCHASGQCGG